MTDPEYIVDHEQKLLRAFEYHVSGNSTEADALYREVLDANPNNLFATMLSRLVKMQFSFARMSKQSALVQLKNGGFLPRTVIDVGAQVGTPPLYEVFPDAHHIMLEPMVEHETALKKICQSLKSAEYKLAAVSNHKGVVALEFSNDKQFSQIVESNNAGVNVRSVDAVTLDGLCTGWSYAGPFLIKIDVDGQELDVLEGATGLVIPENIFVIEATLIDQEPRFSKILDFFKPFGFVLYDIIDALHRPSDLVLWQVDVVMVHESSPLRQNKRYF